MLKKVEISHRTILFTVFFLLTLWLLFQVRQIIFLVYVSFILMVALNPLVSRLEKIKIPRGLAIILCYLGFLSALSLIIGSFLPVLVEQTRRLLEKTLPLLQSLDGQLNTSAFNNQMALLPERSLKLLAGLFSNFFGLFVLLVITFYLLLERKKLSRYLLIIFGRENGQKVEKLIEKIEAQLGGWVRGQTLLCLIVGLMSYVGLWFLGVEFALPLALLAGILEVLPNIGPTLAAVPAVLIGFLISPVSALAVAALYILIQQIENYLIVPGVMRRAVHLSPLIIILSLMIGGKIGGLAGLVLAVPTVLILRVIVLELAISKRFQNS